MKSQLFISRLLLIFIFGFCHFILNAQETRKGYSLFRLEVDDARLQIENPIPVSENNRVIPFESAVKGTKTTLEIGNASQVKGLRQDIAFERLSIGLNAILQGENTAGENLVFPGLVAGKPNLTIYTGPGSDNSYTFNSATNELSASTSVQNNGNSTADNFRTGFYLSTDTIISVSDFSLGYCDSIYLATSQYLMITLTIDLDYRGLTSGNYYLGIMVDDKNNVTESDEKDNNYYIDTAIAPVFEELPNLTISSLYDSHNSYNFNYSTNLLELNTRVLNDGVISAGSFRVGFYLSVDTHFGPEDPLIVSETQTSLKNGDYVDKFLAVDLDTFDLTSGIYYIMYYYDDLLAVTESDETDNGYYFLRSIDYEAPPNINVEPTSLTINQPGSASAFRSVAQAENSKEDISASASLAYKKGLLVPDDVKKFWKTHEPQFSFNSADLKTSIDWSVYDSPVKNQSSCNSCWAFAAIALVENLGNQTDLSEQTIISCAEGDCDGGWYFDALEYIRNHGVPPESCYPLININGNCSDKCDDPAFLERITSFTGSMGLWGEPAKVNDIRSALNSGPICVSLRIPEDGTFDAYSGGIYNYNGGSIPWKDNVHAVLVVGYNDEEQYFLIKNSWGSSWGEGGYMRIAYDDVTDDVYFGSYGLTASGVYTMYDPDGITITNTGTRTLQVTSIVSDKSWLTFNPALPTTWNISAGNSTFLGCNVNWNGVSCPNEQATVTINSNDPAEPVIYVHVTAVPQTTNSPSTATINGSDTICQDSITTYTASASDASAFAWTVPSGWTINTGQGTASISVSVGSNSGIVCATPSNICGNGTMGCLSVTVNSLPGLVIISGDGSICQGDTATYTALATNATSYTWKLPDGWIINSGQGTASVSITAGSNSGRVYATPSNSCGDGSSQYFAVIVNVHPDMPAKIYGETNPELYRTYEYSVEIVAGADNYLWQVKEGNLVNKRSQAIVTWNALGTQQLSVNSENECGESASAVLLVDVQPTYVEPITGDNTKVYPNPSTGILTIKLRSGSNQCIRVSLTDITGHQVYIKEIREFDPIRELTIDISHLSYGIYTLTLSNSDFIEIKKIIRK